MSGRIVLIPFSPRVAPGLLSAAAWRLLTASDVVVHTGSAEHPALPYLDDADVQIVVFEEGAAAAEIARDLVDQARAGAAVAWLAAPDGDQPLARALGGLLSDGGEVGLELLPGSYDLPGAKVLDLIAVMDRLRSPGGCPWDAKQTHQSLVRYLLEEAYETVETIEDGKPEEPGEGRDALREELGDVLFQVLFHSRIAQEHPTDPFSLDEVAEGTAQKLIGRHPHVFGDANYSSEAELHANWERIKVEEKGRTSAVDGVPLAQPALALTDKLFKRADAHGVELDGITPSGDSIRELFENASDTQSVGDLLLAITAHAHSLGVDPEEALRTAARGLRARIVAFEASRDPGKAS
ncbi:MAG TPA: MazG family protein [Actinocrinis sp.]